eukprot:7965540-Pyramimonas_sp.AAC.1
MQDLIDLRTRAAQSTKKVFVGAALGRSAAMSSPLCSPSPAVCSPKDGSPPNIARLSEWSPFNSTADEPARARWRIS